MDDYYDVDGNNFDDEDCAKIHLEQHADVTNNIKREAYEGTSPREQASSAHQASITRHQVASGGRGFPAGRACRHKVAGFVSRWRMTARSPDKDERYRACKLNTSHQARRRS